MRCRHKVNRSRSCLVSDAPIAMHCLHALAGQLRPNAGPMEASRWAIKRKLSSTIAYRRPGKHQRAACLCKVSQGSARLELTARLNCNQHVLVPEPTRGMDKHITLCTIPTMQPNHTRPTSADRHGPRWWWLGMVGLLGNSTSSRLCHLRCGVAPCKHTRNKSSRMSVKCTCEAARAASASSRNHQCKSFVRHTCCHIAHVTQYRQPSCS
jgi:hypothetical protein